MKAFEIKVDGKSLDYRVPHKLDLDDVRRFFEKRYEVVKIWQGGRHVLLDVKKDGRNLFLKLATSEGISAVTKVEYDWNNAFNGQIDRKLQFWVPKNVEYGFFKSKLFYIVTDKFEGELISDWPKTKQADEVLGTIGKIIDLCEFIQGLKFENLSERFYGGQNYQDFFITKAKAWLDSIPFDVKNTYDLENLFKVVKASARNLEKRPRHGDFAPWHIFLLAQGKLGLIDGEHALAGGVENYDICYFIQRVFSVLEAPDAAVRIFDELLRRGYKVEKLRTILAARAIGGFLDESLGLSPNYLFADKFKNWIFLG